MAIDKNKTKILLENIDQLFQSLTGDLPKEARDFLQSSIMGPALKEISRMIQESRPPVLFMIGRSGHGKSSLINALSGKHVSEVGDIKPTTPESIPYLISFEERFSSWQVIDSRGIFETTRPDGAPREDALDHLSRDVLKYRPDVIMHVISAPEIRNLAHDLEAFRRISMHLKQETGSFTPAIIVLNKADTLGNPRDWPPESSANKAGLIHQALEYMTDEVLRVNRANIDLNTPLRGFLTDDELYLGVIPVCGLAEEPWNVETLGDFIGRHLPESALLDFYQARRRKEQLKQLSSSMIKRFSIIASGIGASPIAFSDFLALAPLQLLMLAVIGGLSCRPVSKETAAEYLSAAGINLVAAGGIRYLSRQLLKLIPVAGWALSGSIAGSGTFALGKAAEAYFFAGEIEKPEKYRLEWEKIKELGENDPRG